METILSNPEIDVALVGPEDLSLSYGVPGQTNHPEVIKAIERVINISEKKNVASGIHMGNIEALKKWRSKGMQMIMYNSDLGFLIDGATENLETLKKDT